MAATVDDVINRFGPVLDSIRDSSQAQKDSLANLLTQFVEERNDAATRASLSGSRGGSGGGSSGSGSGGTGALSSIASGLLGAGSNFAGLASLGLGIAGFFGALSLGSMGLNWLGADYSGLSTHMSEFSDAMTSLSPIALAALGAIIGISAFAGKDGIYTGAVMTSIGAGIGGFFAGLSLSSAIAGGLGWMGVDYSGIVKHSKVFSDAVTAMDPLALVALGGIIGMGILVSKVQGTSGLWVGPIMTSIGAGIAGFFLGLVGVGSLLDKIPNSGSLVKAFETFNAAVMSLEFQSIAALGAMVGLATTMGFKDSAETATALTALGLGISGFMTSFMLGDTLVSWVGALPSGSDKTMVDAFKTFNAAVNALDPAAIVALGGLIASSKVVGPQVAVILPALGVGIAGFMGAFMLGDKLASWISLLPGSNGESMVNAFAMFGKAVGALVGGLGDGVLEQLVKYAEYDLVSLGDGLTSLGKGLFAFLSTTGLAAIGGLIGDALDKAKDAFKWVFGIESEESSKPTLIESVIASLEPLKTLDMSLIENMSTFGNAIEDFVNSFNGLINIDPDKVGDSLYGAMEGLAAFLSMKDNLMTGGTWKPPGQGFLSSRGDIKFGAGLEGLTDENVETIKAGVSKIYDAMNITIAPKVDALNNVAAGVDGSGSGFVNVNQGGTTIINNNYYNTTSNVDNRGMPATTLSNIPSNDRR